MGHHIKSKFYKITAVAGWLLFFLAGMGLEYYSVLALFSENSPLPMAPRWILFNHVWANYMMARGLSGLLPPPYRAQRFRSFVYYFLIGLFIPMIGNIGLLFVDLLGIRRQKIFREKEQLWRTTEQAPMPARAPQVRSKPAFGAHGMLSRLQKSNDLKAHLGIVLATRSMRDENAVPLLNVALKNPQDDVRLLAFTLLEKKTAHINTNIEKLQRSLKKETNKAKVQVAIAKNYLQLVTLGLVQAEMKPQVLELAARHIEEALKEDSGFRNAHFILGRIRLEQGRVDPAEAAFNRALDLGFAATEIYPFLAQVAYRRREFGKIPQYLKQIPDAYRRYDPLAKVAAYWLPEAIKSN